MKINVEIELDWINNDYDIDECVKNRIVGKIADKILKDAKSEIEKKSMKKP